MSTLVSIDPSRQVANPTLAMDASVDIDRLDPSTNTLHLSGPNERGEFTLLHGLSYDIGRGPQSLIVRVPQGFVTDFSSIPWYAQALFPKFGPHNLAAILHDYLYETRVVGFEVANAIFYEVLRATPGVPRWKAVVMATTVQLFGKQRYNT